ncbi:MAG: hypothetical protein CL494_08015 [Actinobacteria bacterium]|nr:hypothetical protein [Actinomycetota bacterium]
MVKNLNTLERSLQVRVGKYQADEQSLNSVVINASDTPIVASNAGIYMAPLRQATEAEGLTSNVITYNQTTKEIFDSGLTSHQIQNLANVCEQGATTSTTVSFTNPTTSFITTTQVGIANVTPVNTLDVGTNFSVSDTGSNVLTVRGGAFIDGDLTTTGTVTSVKSVNLEVSDPIIEIGKNNTDANFLFDAGVVMNRPAGGNIALVYRESQDEFAIGYTDDNASDRFIEPEVSGGLGVRVYGNVTSDTYFGSAEFMTGISNIAVLESNVSALNQNIASNLAVARTDLQSNVVLVRTDIDSNLAVARGDLQSNVTILRGDLQSNVALLRTDIDSNLAVARTDLQSNVTILNQNIASNINQANVYARADLQSNVSILQARLNDNSFRITTNATDLAETRAWVASNAVTLNQNIASNLNAANTYSRGDLQSNVGILNNNIASNLAVARSDLQSNVGILNQNVVSNIAAVRTDLQDNVTALNTTINDLSLQDVTDVANTVSDCVKFTNTSTSLVTSGSVGVNVTAPTEALQVEGNVLASHALFASGTVLGNTAAQADTDIVNKLTGNTTIQGNLHVIGSLSEFIVTNKDLRDPILGLGVGVSGVSDVGFIGEQDGAANSNIACGFEASSKEFIIGYTDEPTSATTLNVDSTQEMNVNIAGSLTAATSISASQFLGNGTTLTGVATSAHLQSNVTLLRADIDSNLAAARNDLQSNVTILRGDLQSNVTTLRADIDSNLAVARTDLQSNVTILNQNIASNVNQANAYARADLQSNVGILNNNITSNIAAVRADLQDNVTTIGNTYAPLVNPTFTSGITVTTTASAAAVTVSDLTPGRVVFVDTGDTLADDADLTWTKSAGGVAPILAVDGDLSCSNLIVSGGRTEVYTVNAIVNDALIELANNNVSDTLDMGIIMTRPTSNVAIGYRGDESEFMIGHTHSDPSSVNLVPDTSRDLHVHAYGKLTVESNLEVGSSANVLIDHTCGDVKMTHTDDGSSAGPVLTLHRVSASASDGDYMGQLKFTGKNDAGATKVYAKMTAKTNDVTDGTEDGLFEFAVHKNGSIDPVGRLTSSALKLINDTGLEVNGTSTFDETATFSDAVTGINVSTGNCVVAGNVTASTFHGSGQALTNLPTTLQSASDEGASSDQTISLTHATTGLSVTSNVSVGEVVFASNVAVDNTNPAYQLSVGPNVFVHDGTVTATIFSGSGANLTGIATNLQAITDNGPSTNRTVSFTNVTTGITVSSNLVASGNVTALKFIGDGSALTGLVSDLQSVTAVNATSNRKITLTNATGIQASGNVLCANLTSSNVVYAAEGLVTNTSSVGPTIKRYAYSGSMANSNVAMVFSTHTFYAKITAQLIHDSEDISTFVFEISGGKNASSGTSSKDIALGRVNKFGHANSYNWHDEVVASPTELVIKPHQAASGGGNYSYDLFIEYMSSHAGGKLVKIMENQVDQHSFAY